MTLRVGVARLGKKMEVGVLLVGLATRVMIAKIVVVVDHHIRCIHV